MTFKHAVPICPIRNLRYPSSIREEELKNKVAADFFSAFDCTRIIGNIDFCVDLPATELALGYDAEIVSGKNGGLYVCTTIHDVGDEGWYYHSAYYDLQGKYCGETLE